MALTIDNPEAERLARELAERTGETIADAVTTALRERLRLARAQEANQKKASDWLREARVRLAQLPVLDDRTPEEIVGYDESGLPV